MRLFIQNYVIDTEKISFISELKTQKENGRFFFIIDGHRQYFKGPMERILSLRDTLVAYTPKTPVE
ncbi:MAG: hypothetical protein MRZ79_04810 [Bacteroidia bacterium]|nr:hypothetical protein [Bacteroidia bacterium]